MIYQPTTPLLNNIILILSTSPGLDQDLMRGSASTDTEVVAIEMETIIAMNVMIGTGTGIEIGTGNLG